MRTVATVLLIALVPLLFVLLLAALAVAQILFFQRSTGDGLRWAIVLVPAAIVMIRGLRTLVAPICTTPVGTPITEAEHPALWALVRQLAVVAETEPPDEIYLTAQANASVMEDTRLLGLVSIRRRMFVGAPLIAGLDTAALAAVLTHELAHYARRHTRLAVIAYRSRAALVSTTAVLHGDLVQWVLRKLLSAWTKLYLRVSMGLSRRQEREADQAAARAVGSATAARAWREVCAIGESWVEFRDKYVMMGWPNGYLPDDVYGGYARFRAALADWLDELRANPPAEKPDRYDTHPPMAQRIAAFEATPVTAVTDVGVGAATGLLRNASTVMHNAWFSSLPPQARGHRRVDWTTLARVTGMAALSVTAAPVLGALRPPTMRSLLAALDDGRVTELSGVEPEPGIGPRAQREFARPALRDGLFAVMSGVLTEAGAGGWELAWRLGVRFACDLDVADAVDAAVDEPPDTTPLREALAKAGVDLDRTMSWRDEDVDTQDVQRQAPGGRPLPG